MNPSQTKLISAALSILALVLVAFEGHAIAGPQPTVQVATIAAKQAAVSVNLASLKSSLRKTDAIGFMTKLSLKHKLDSLVESFGEYHKGRGEHTISSLRRRFSDLFASTLSLVREHDPQLFRILWDAQAK